MMLDTLSSVTPINHQALPQTGLRVSSSISLTNTTQNLFSLLVLTVFSAFTFRNSDLGDHE